MSPEASASAAPAGRLVVERPPAGLARGAYAFPAWGIALVGAAVVLLTLAYLWRARRRRGPA
jgi:hypothetical protein